MRTAAKHDVESLLEMPPYGKAGVVLPSNENVLVAEKAGKVLGAVSVGHKDVTFSSSEYNDDKQPPNGELQKVSGPWISKLFVFPEYRYQGIGTKLIGEAIRYLEAKGFAEAYAGIYIKNAFREVSQQIFRDNGFEEAGSCICSFSNGHCQGALLKRVIVSSDAKAPVRGQTESDDNELTSQIIALGLSMGAELVGFASAEKLEEGAPEGHRPSDLMPNAKNVIILACGRKLNEDRHYFYRWGPNFSLTYIKLKDEVKQRRIETRRCIEAVKKFLMEKEFKVVTEPHGWSGILSFKMAAYLAGLGVFGKGGFLVHPRLGALNVLACILTDAPLKRGVPLEMDVCKDCMECIKACKYGAFKKANEIYSWFPEKCRSYDLIMNPVTLKWTYGPCNSKCVMNCPIGTPS